LTPAATNIGDSGNGGGKHRLDGHLDDTIVLGNAADIAKAAELSAPRYTARHAHIEIPSGPAGASGEPGEKPLSSKLRRGAAWSAASTLIMRFGNIAIMAVVARTLAPRDFGIFAVAMTIHAIVSSIAELGVASCLIRGDVDVDEYAPTVGAISLISSTVFAAIMFVFARPLSAAVGSVDAAPAMRVMALAVVLVGIFAVPGAELARDFRQDAQFYANLAGFVVANSVLLVLAKNGGGALSFAWSRVVGQLAVGAGIWFFVRRYHRPRLSRQHAKFVLGFGLPLAGANLLNYAMLNTDYVFVGHLLGPIELGLYMLAFNISSWAGSLMNSMLNTIAMPAFSRIKHDAELLETGLVRAFVALSFIALPTCALTATLAHPLVRTVYGGRWDKAATVLAVLAIYGAISVFCLLCGNVLSGMGRTNLLLVTQIPWLGALVVGMAIGVHFGGIEGAAWAHTVVVCCVALPVYLYMVKRATNVRFMLVIRAVFPVVVAAGAAAGTAAAVSHMVSNEVLRLLLGGSTGSVVYICLALPMAADVLGGRRLPLPASLTRAMDSYADALRRVGLGIAAPEPATPTNVAKDSY